MDITTSQIVEVLKNDPKRFGHYLGYDKLTDIHNVWHKIVWRSKVDQTLMSHRGSYKTSGLLIIGAVIHMIINPAESLCIMRKEYSDHVRPAVKEIGKLMQSDKVRDIIKRIYNIDPVIEATDSEINTNLSAKRKGLALKGVSLKSSLTGLHFDKIITDDICTIKDRISKAEREYTILIYQELQNIRNPGGTISNIGTPWHKDDVYSIMPKAHRYSIYDTNLPEFTKEHINNLKSGGMTHSLFAANYELKHIADEDSLFPDPKKGDHPQGLPYKMHIDAAYKGADTIAVTLMAKANDHLFAIGWVFPGNIEDHYSDIHALWLRYRAGTLLMEDNADKGLSATQFRKLGIPVSSYHEKENKHVKIIGHLYRDWKRIIWHNDTDNAYLDQIVSYIEGEGPDDAPDSAACLCRHFGKGRNVSKLEIMGI